MDISYESRKKVMRMEKEASRKRGTKGPEGNVEGLRKVQTGGLEVCTGCF